ncbi:MAG TPA: histidine phosphatase family protein [Jatrophihabitantaceae bacterium]|nr:histidine phosphatase family protein [Jatrophihabitantaceae bacterium]
MSDATAKAGSAAGPAFATAERLPDDVELWLVRHGETEWSASGRHTGRTDIALTAAGERQARALLPMLSELSPALVLSSPRRRALHTAELAGLQVDEVVDDLAEWDYGSYEGRTSNEIRAERPGWSLWRDGVPPGDGAETIEQVSARADRVLTRACRALADGPVVLFAHGHISRVLGARWIGLPAASGANLLLGTAAPSLLSTQYGEPVIAHWNLPNPASRGGIAP